MARKILLADDSVTAQNMGRKILTDAGYDVITVNNGSAALKRVAEHKPDLIVLDVYMPGYSGLEVCARLKDAPDTARIPILLTVGKLEPFKPEEAQRVHADAFIVKPFEASELLSALTRLEDRMVPQADGGARFTTSVSGIERFTGDPTVRKSDEDGEGESGWKSRLRFPSKKKKEEPEPEPEADFVTTPYRDLKRAGKAPASAPFSVSAGAAQEPGLVPDIPRDITPEELDALSELVAKLDGPIPASENITTLGERIGPVETQAASAGAKQAEVAATVPEPFAEVKQETEAAPVAVEAKYDTPEAFSAPVADAIPSYVEPVPAAVEIAHAELVSTAAVPAETAPEPVAAEKSEEPPFVPVANTAEVQISEPVAEQEKQETPTEVATAPSTAAESVPVKPVPPVEEVRVEEPARAEEILQAAPAAIEPPPAEAETPAPSAEELAEALRLLTPSQTPGTVPTLAEAGAALVEELGRDAGVGSRWVAEAVALSPEEASASLEAEMFRTFATPPAGGEVPVGNGNGATVIGHEEEEAAEAAVEAAEAGAETRDEAPTPRAAEESPAAVASSAAPEAIAAATGEPQATHADIEEPVAATTFADAVRQEEIESVAAGPETLSSEATGSAEQEAVSSSDDGAGGQEDMGKDTKKGGKSNWHQIHSATAPAAIQSDVVEAAKQEEEAPKAMAAAASAEGASDASSIASIVDSVLADLRPKIVEEIAKKLAKK